MIDVFRVGVTLAFTSNAPQMLSVILRQMGELNVASEAVGRNMALAGGAIAAFGGAAVLKGLWDVIEGGRELNKELEKTKQLGGEFALKAPEARANAFQMNRDVPTVDAAEGVKLQREMSLTLGHPVALALAEAAARTAAVVAHATGQSADTITKDLVRMADLRGQIYAAGPDDKEHVDPAKLQAEMNAAGRGLILGQGFVTSGELLTGARQSGAISKSQTPEAFYGAGVEAGIAMGTSKLGTAETGLMQEFIGGTMTKRTAEALQRGGMLHEGEWKSGKSGGVVVGPEATKRFEPMMQDPIAWLTSGPGAEGVKRAAAADGISVLSEIFHLFGRQTVQRLASEALSNEPQFARAREIYHNIPGMDEQYKELQNKDLDINVTAITAAWKSLMQAISEAGTPGMIGVLQSLTNGIHAITQAVSDHPDAARTILELAGGFAAVTALGGSLLIVSAALGPFATGLGLLTSTMAAGNVATAISNGAGLSSLIARIAGPLGIVLIGVELGNFAHDVDSAVPALRRLDDAVRSMVLGIGKSVADFVTNIGKSENADTRQKLDQTRKDRGSGLGPTTLTPQDAGPDGRPLVQKQSFLAAPATPTNTLLQPIAWRPDTGSGGYTPPSGSSGQDRADGSASGRYAPPPAATEPTVIQATNNIVLDGRTMATQLTEYQVRGLSGPSNGYSGPDLRMSPAAAYQGAA